MNLPQPPCPDSQEAGDLSEPYRPVAVHYEATDYLEYVSRDVPTCAVFATAGMDKLVAIADREPIGWRIYGWSRIAPPPPENSVDVGEGLLGAIFQLIRAEELKHYNRALMPVEHLSEAILSLASSTGGGQLSNKEDQTRAVAGAALPSLRSGRSEAPGQAGGCEP